MRDNKGMTIIEVVVALAIFMIIVVMAFPIITQSGMINSESQKRQEAEAQGVLLAEYLIYYASGYDDKNTFINEFLERDISGDDFNVFSCSLDVCSNSKDNIDYDINLVDDHRVRISIKYSKQLYESIIWLKYKDGVDNG